MTQISEPRNEKEVEKENSNENQPDAENSGASTDQQQENKPTVQPEGYVPKAQYDELETRYKESSREAIVQKQRADVFQSRKELTNEPTDSELQAAIPGWDYLDDVGKDVARRAYNAERIARDLANERAQERADRQWNTDLELAIAQNPSLQGKELAFKEYANKPSHRGAPMDVLMDAFLHRNPAAPATQSPTPQPGLEAGNGGPRGPEKPKTLSASELKTLRETDEKAWREYISTHDVSDMLD
jgi:hypothetical protein